MTGGPTVGEFLARVAIALPLVLLLAVAVLMAWRRWAPAGLWAGVSAGGSRGMLGRAAARLAASGPVGGRRAGGGDVLALDGQLMLAPGVRVAAVRFEGRRVLLGVAGQTLVRLDRPGEGP